ncbi:hypothetical protein H2199_003357 [Coniosporium tulheliwenetii]|uniref:Uncharacterized protein n=1 Tax=Coniosporium tulheliwenetii TaxID=3383036 RepID=A0ACC2ZE53_9PEZI|nr:hypothetical protein H2199_003357 [Cladosporium sp. JES 115]
MTKSVCIIGAGPSGLVAAKTVLHAAPKGAFSVTILEKASRVGGMWALQNGEIGEKCSPGMATNLSRFTVAFSDLSWNSVDLGEGTQDTTETRNGNLDPGTRQIPMFPKAWQVGRYLQNYASKFIPSSCISLNSSVTSAEHIKHEGGEKWKVVWATPRDPDTPVSGYPSDDQITQPLQGLTVHESLFDHLIIASGFFSEPKPLKLEVPLNQEGQPNLPLKSIHSSKFRNLEDLLPEVHHGGGNVVVIGGGMSGAEAAATAAFKISSACHSPSGSTKSDDLKVHHVSSRPFYAIPRYLPQELDLRPAPTFAPLDLCFYDLGRRPEGPIMAMNGLMTSERAAKTHKFLRALLGGGPADQGYPTMEHTADEANMPAYVAISDNYTEFVRSGLIVPIRGRAMKVEVAADVKGPGESRVRLKGMNEMANGSKQDDSNVTIPNVVGIIYATGFSSHPSISYLSPAVREVLECDNSCHRLPLLLSGMCTCHDRIPSLGFVGFYEGPYWGVIELQARAIVARWADMNIEKPDDDHLHGSHETPAAGEASTERGTNSSTELNWLRTLRAAMLQSSPSVPQYWMGDYVGIMEGLAADLSISRDDSGFGGRVGPCIPARYAGGAGIDHREAQLQLEDLRSTLSATKNDARFVAAAAFRGLQGNGQADFFPQVPTDSEFDAEYLYVESGTFTLENGMQMSATRRYVYRYSADRDQISVWFVKENGRSVDYLFNKMKFQTVSEPSKDGGHSAEAVDGRGNRGWIATGDHLCEKDMYESEAEFKFRGASLPTFGIKYVVKGPRKDYVSETWYER